MDWFWSFSCAKNSKWCRNVNYCFFFVVDNFSFVFFFSLIFFFLIETAKCKNNFFALDSIYSLDVKLSVFSDWNDTLDRVICTFNLWAANLLRVCVWAENWLINCLKNVCVRKWIGYNFCLSYVLVGSIYCVYTVAAVWITARWCKQFGRPRALTPKLYPKAYLFLSSSFIAILNAFAFVFGFRVFFSGFGFILIAYLFGKDFFWFFFSFLLFCFHLFFFSAKLNKYITTRNWLIKLHSDRLFYINWYKSFCQKKNYYDPNPFEPNEILFRKKKILRFLLFVIFCFCNSLPHCGAFGCVLAMNRMNYRMNHCRSNSVSSSLPDPWKLNLYRKSVEVIGYEIVGRKHQHNCSISIWWQNWITNAQAPNWERYTVLYVQFFIPTCFPSNR